MNKQTNKKCDPLATCSMDGQGEKQKNAKK